MNSTITSPLRVFVVEDSTPVRERLAQHIEANDLTRIVGVAEDVVLALQGIEATDPEAVVLDLRLTDSNGLDLLHALRNRTDPIVTIVLTNYATPVFRAASFGAGADYFFDKTTEFDHAMETIATLAREKMAGRRAWSDPTRGVGANSAALQSAARIALGTKSRTQVN